MQILLLKLKLIIWQLLLNSLLLHFPPFFLPSLNLINKVEGEKNGVILAVLLCQNKWLEQTKLGDYECRSSGKLKFFYIRFISSLTDL